MLSAFGKMVRKLRIDKGVTLKEMAKTLRKTPAYLSAVETGRKNPPQSLVQEVAEYFGLDREQSGQLSQLAQESRSEISIPLHGLSGSHREAAAAFARQFPSMTTETLDQFKEFLSKQ